MFRRSQIIQFIIRLVVVYLLLVIPWPGSKDAYSRAFRSMSNATLGSQKKIVVEFRPIKDDEVNDINIVVKKKGSKYFWNTPIDSRLTGFLPTAMVVALVLATPIPWQRLWKALLWALLGIHIFIYLRMAVGVFYSKSVAQLTPFFEFGEFWTKATYRVYEIVGRAPTISFMVPVIIWLLVSFRRSDFEQEEIPKATTRGGAKHKKRKK